MYKKLGVSVYLSSFDTQKEMLKKLEGSKYFIFTSFHIQEELNHIMNFKQKAKEMCQWLKDYGFTIIGDVSPKTLKFFEYNDVTSFAKDLNLDLLRIDYGFSDEELITIAKEYPIAFNASTVDMELAQKIKQSGNEVYAFHNFYPRPETGLDDVLFRSINQQLMELGLNVLAFIPGDELKRGPLNEGLPTLESHRDLPPYLSFLDLLVNYRINTIFIGDIKLSDVQRQLITQYLENGIIQIPVTLLPEYVDLYNQTFTIRVDSPYQVMRLKESREYSCHGEDIQPFNCITRNRGAITMDNIRYKRYSGEIQILREQLKMDEKVNVIGSILIPYLNIMTSIKNGQKIKLIKL